MNRRAHLDRYKAATVNKSEETNREVMGAPSQTGQIEVMRLQPQRMRQLGRDGEHNNHQLNPFPRGPAVAGSPELPIRHQRFRADRRRPAHPHRAGSREKRARS
jgi:hypothetical protein